MSSIRVMACTSCAFRAASKVFVCPACGHAMEIIEVSSVGRVWSYTHVHLPFGDFRDGYKLFYVDLDQGPRILCRTCPNISGFSIGDRVEVKHIEQSDDKYEPQDLDLSSNGFTLEAVVWES